MPNLLRVTPIICLVVAVSLPTRGKAEVGSQIVFDGTLNKRLYSYAVTNRGEVPLISWYLLLPQLADWTWEDMRTPPGWEAVPPDVEPNAARWVTFVAEGGDPIAPGETLGGFAIPSSFGPGPVAYYELQEDFDFSGDSGQMVQGPATDEVIINPLSLTPAPGSFACDAMPTISAILIGPPANVDEGSIQLIVDGAVVQHIYDPISQRIEYTPAAPLERREHSAMLTLQDKAGKDVPPASWTFSTCCLGDVSGDGSVSPLDAALILMQEVGRIVLPDPRYPCFTVATGDVSGDGDIDSYDASLVLQKVVELIDRFPVEEQAAPQWVSAEARLRLVPIAHGRRTFTVGLYLENARNVLTTSLRLDFDPSQVAVTQVTPRYRTGTKSRPIDLPLLASHVTGDTVAVALADSTPLPAGVPLLTLTFQRVSPHLVQEEALFKVVEAKINGQAIRGSLPQRTDIVSIRPSQSGLGANYPNPFNPETWIPYQLAIDAAVTLTIHDATGRLVRTLELGLKPAGIYWQQHRAAYWDGRNDFGEPVASGIYFYTLRAGGFTTTRRMLLVK